jgi:HEAT repeat protein
MTYGDEEAIAMLVKRVSNRAPGARLSAEQALRPFGARAIRALITAMADKDDDIAFGSKLALARWGEPAVPDLIEALAAEGPEHITVAAAAAQVLGRLGDQRAVGPLAETMRRGSHGRGDPLRRLNEAAANALADLDEFDLLTGSLEDADDNLTAIMILALRRLGNSIASDFLVSRQRKSTDAAILLNSGCALVDFDDPRAVEPLMRLFEAEYLYRDIVTTQLARLQNPAAIEPLTQVLEEVTRSGSTHSKARGADAAKGLERFADDRAIPPLIRLLATANAASAEVAWTLGRFARADVTAALLKAIEHNDDEVRASAAAALAMLGDNRGLEHLLNGLNHNTYAFHAGLALARMGDERGEPALLRIAETDRNHRPFMDQPVIALAATGSKRGFELLLQLFPELQSKGVNFMGELCKVIEIFGDSGDERASEPLIASAGSCWAKVRHSAVRALGRLRNPRNFEFVANWLTSGEDDMRSAAAVALGDLGDPRAVDPLVLALDDIDLEVQSNAARALAGLGDARAVEAVIGLLGRKPRQLRLAAIKALGQIGSTAAVGSLEMVRDDDDPIIRACSAEALGKLKAQSLPVALANSPAFKDQDNVGTRHETQESVEAFWLPYVMNRPDFPFIFYEMREKDDAMGAMLSLSPLKVAADSGKVICTDVLDFGIYPNFVKGQIRSWGFFLAGRRITPQLYEAAIASCKKHNGTNARVSDSPNPAFAVSMPPAGAASVTFDREERVDILEEMRARNIEFVGLQSSASRPSIATKRFYRATSRDVALGFLKANVVDVPFYYLVVRTPDGIFGRDKDGIYEQPD